MKKFIGALLIVVFLGIPYFSLHAAIVVDVITDSSTFFVKSFSIKLKEVNKIFGTNTYRFDFETKVASNSGVTHWEVRIWCEDGVTVGFNQNILDQCNQGNVVLDQNPESFLVFLNKSKDEERAKFSFKLKGFDKDGKWVHSEKKSFVW